MMSRQWWYGLSTEERIAHYKRVKHLPTPRGWNCACDFDDTLWPRELRESYSLDPYFYAPHGGTHDPEKCKANKCPCVTCVAGIGHGKACIPDGSGLIQITAP